MVISQKECNNHIISDSLSKDNESSDVGVQNWQIAVGVVAGICVLVALVTAFILRRKRNQLLQSRNNAGKFYTNLTHGGRYVVNITQGLYFARFYISNWRQDSKWKGKQYAKKSRFWKTHFEKPHGARYVFLEQKGLKNAMF